MQFLKIRIGNMSICCCELSQYNVISSRFEKMLFNNNCKIKSRIKSAGEFRSSFKKLAQPRTSQKQAPSFSRHHASEVNL